MGVPLVAAENLGKKMLFRSMPQIRSAIPLPLFNRDTRRSLYYLLRDVALAAVLLGVGIEIDSLFDKLIVHDCCRVPVGWLQTLRWFTWAV